MNSIIPCLAAVSIFLIVFGFLAFLRYITYRETLVLAEKGLVRPIRERKNGKDTLRWGIVITALGMALCVGMYPLGFMLRTEFPLGFGPWMLFGLIPTFFGLALILVYVLTREPKPKEPSDEEPLNPPDTGPN